VEYIVHACNAHPGLVAERDRLAERAESAEAERDEARAELAKLRAVTKRDAERVPKRCRSCEHHAGGHCHEPSILAGHPVPQHILGSPDDDECVWCPLARLAEPAAVPECVKRWRQYTSASRGDVKVRLNRSHADRCGDPYGEVLRQDAADCLEWLATHPHPTPALVLGREEGDVEVLREWQTLAPAIDPASPEAENALSRAHIYPASVVDELVGAADMVCKTGCGLDRLRKALAALPAELKGE
jgi:hypothetical protein